MLIAGYSCRLVVSPRPVIGAGLLVLACGLCLIHIQAHFPPADLGLLFAGLIFTGIGCGTAYPALAAEVSETAPPASLGRVYGAYRMWRDFGYAVSGLSS